MMLHRRSTLAAGLVALVAGCASHQPPVAGPELTDPVAVTGSDTPPPRHYNLKTPAALAAALHDAAGYEAGPDQCGRWLDDKIYLVASFAYDYGCAADGYFADGWYQPSRATSAPGLQLLGW